MVAPFTPGGTTDAIARILAEGLRIELGQPVIVENVGGAGGVTGANRVAKAAPDGYQFVLGSLGTHAQSQSFYKKPPYNAATDFAPVALVTDQSISTSRMFPIAAARRLCRTCWPAGSTISAPPGPWQCRKSPAIP